MTDETQLDLLREIRDHQREALRLQQEHVALYRDHMERIERINGRAELLQLRAAKALKLILLVAIPLVLLLLGLMLWPYLSAVLST